MEHEPARADFLLDRNGVAHIHPELERLTQEQLYSAVRRAQEGCEDSFAVIYNHYNPRVERDIRDIVGNTQDAEDLASVTFMKAWQALPRFEFQEGATFYSWLVTIGKHVSFDYLKAKKAVLSMSRVIVENGSETHVGESILDTNETIDPQIHSQRAEDLKRTGIAIGELIEEQRDAVIQFAMGYSHKEIAEKCGTTPGNVRVLVHRGRANLRKILGSGLNTIDLGNEGVA